ncbi:hypothetical protein BV898_17515 [Hypsibius exemplaris]|uniref:Uncharacterized protein n=1 Tax=Hypsibius exemplaris TaxID=2072580 RepID=A0A9X6NFR7_HYPEX|nr:hypothetical protein BV898_17515 [Hypsibius exemplaris]
MRSMCDERNAISDPEEAGSEGCVYRIIVTDRVTLGCPGGCQLISDNDHECCFFAAMALDLEQLEDGDHFAMSD